MKLRLLISLNLGLTVFSSSLLAQGPTFNIPAAANVPADTNRLGVAGPADANNDGSADSGVGVGMTNRSLLESVTQSNDVANRIIFSSPSPADSKPRTIMSDTAIPSAMALIPAGPFTMGDNLDGESDAEPIGASVSAFYMDVNLVSYAQWQSVFAWATNHGYDFIHAGSGKAPNHPVQFVDWYDAVKWCNARSQKGGRTPVYYSDMALTKCYTNGEEKPLVNWLANGYRLPTEAEWEKAARGGASGQRFPWGNVITESLANYYAETNGCNYDWGPNGYNAAFTNGSAPYTSPVGYFAPNGYGLYDMAGNVFEWCWDWYGTYTGGDDPHGPASGSQRCLRGGYWFNSAFDARCADRNYSYPSLADHNFGFRCVRGL